MMIDDEMTENRVRETNLIPGSDAAIDAGCTCPVMDNNHGKWLPWQGGWIVVGGCPIHWPAGNEPVRINAPATK